MFYAYSRKFEDPRVLKTDDIYCKPIDLHVGKSPWEGGMSSNVELSQSALQPGTNKLQQTVFF